MDAPFKLGGFAVATAAVLALSFGVGNAIGPIGQNANNTHHEGGSDMKDTTARGPSGHGGNAAAQPGGLMVSGHGYTLELDSTVLSSGTTEVTFDITGPDDQPVTRYESTHDKDLHFIAVRRDTTGFQHVHPTMDARGRWTTTLDLTAGVWRFYADFRPAGHDQTMTLGIDAFVAGGYVPQPIPAPAQTAQVGDYTVTLDGDLIPGAPSELTLTVTRGGQPVTDLQPYLAAYGHLVALRVGDLAYLHVHPDGEPDDGVTKPGPGITFVATAPSAGTYRLFLDFRHDGVVRTAEFSAQAAAQQHAAAVPTPTHTSVKPNLGQLDGHQH
ncbi:hypothetical protein [Williamsia muralis]|uniref:hypothetical protein n=1 Tax=Williamsia marianensis TaxID=85044 RepID=UPI000DE6FEEF|nr:hypothetical protein [Williamsia marianensis]PVY26502.1 hypothetical protein C7458_11515 [Williamsia marianensis]